MAEKTWIRNIVETVVTALVIAFFLRWLIVQAFWIPSGSMIPTLEPNDRVLVLKFWDKFIGTYDRGDIVVFQYPLDPDRDFVKRLIGLPGDTVEIKDGRVFINSREIAEPYVVFPDNFNMPPRDVPDGHYFFLGDNRSNSQDSRFWGFVPRAMLRGPAVFRYWPPSRFGRIE